jgi:hypothetical protein
MCTKRAVLHVGHVDITHHIRSGPQRMTSALENPRAEIDKEQTIDSQRQDKWRPFIKHG